MADDVLSQRALNRALLVRQMLLERSDATIPQALEQMAGLQMQYAPSGYIGLWSRLRNFQRDALTTALGHREVIQATSLRSTIHLLSSRDYVLFEAGVKESRREWWERASRRETADIDMDAVVACMRRALADGPRRQRELQDAVLEAGFPKIAWQATAVYLSTVRVPPSGTWERRRADLYELADRWLGDLDATEEQGLEHLVLRYLGGFGPATVKDISAWAGVPVKRLQPVVDALELREFRSEEGTALVDLRDGQLPDADTPAPVRFLPTWDATLLVHARRTQILPEEYRPLIFSVKNPQSVPTVLIDGAVAGTWRYEDTRINVEYFAKQPRAVQREVTDEAERLATFHS